MTDKVINQEYMWASERYNDFSEERREPIKEIINFGNGIPLNMVGEFGIEKSTVSINYSGNTQASVRMSFTDDEGYMVTSYSVQYKKKYSALNSNFNTLHRKQTWVLSFVKRPVFITIKVSSDKTSMKIKRHIIWNGINPNGEFSLCNNRKQELDKELAELLFMLLFRDKESYSFVDNVCHFKIRDIKMKRALCNMEFTKGYEKGKMDGEMDGLRIGRSDERNKIKRKLIRNIETVHIGFGNYKTVVSSYYIRKL